MLLHMIKIACGKRNYTILSKHKISYHISHVVDILCAMLPYLAPISLKLPYHDILSLPYAQLIVNMTYGTMFALSCACGTLMFVPYP